jgi:hypothetical protein
LPGDYRYRKQSPWFGGIHPDPTKDFFVGNPHCLKRKDMSHGWKAV